MVFSASQMDTRRVAHLNPTRRVHSFLCTQVALPTCSHTKGITAQNNFLEQSLTEHFRCMQKLLKKTVNFLKNSLIYRNSLRDPGGKVGFWWHVQFIFKLTPSQSTIRQQFVDSLTFNFSSHKMVHCDQCKMTSHIVNFYTKLHPERRTN